ncbi:MAG TPA: hypothetical protein VGK69_12175 [Gaiellaceae bacterium]
MAAAHDIIETELDRVERWRTAELMRVGFPGDDAVALAARFDVDLHEAISLVERGCPPELALRILS